MPTPIPVDEVGDCTDCDLCCVLSSVNTVVDSPVTCPKLFFLCQCPGGEKVVQRKAGNDASPYEWEDAPEVDWVTDNQFYVPANHRLVLEESPFSLGYIYRVKCTLADGMIYYSNSIAGTGPAVFGCFDGGVLKKYWMVWNFEEYENDSGSPGAFLSSFSVATLPSLTSAPDGVSVYAQMGGNTGGVVGGGACDGVTGTVDVGVVWKQSVYFGEQCLQTCAVDVVSYTESADIDTSYFLCAARTLIGPPFLSLYRMTGYTLTLIEA